MDLISLIVIICMVVSIAKKKKAKQDKLFEEARQKVEATVGKQMDEKREIREKLRAEAEEKAEARRAAERAAAEKTLAAGGGAASRSTYAAGSTRGGNASAGDASNQNQSTTEYLAQKAKADRIEHAKEKRREEARLRTETGGRAPAMRHYYGDSVQPGMRIVKCGYCGAENEILIQADQKKYTCYFCRENL